MRIQDRIGCQTPRIVLAAALCLLSGISLPQSIQHYLHKRAYLDQRPNQELFNFRHKPITSRQAAHFALKYLQGRGVSGIVICEVTWIAAPLGGFLVDAKGKATLGGATYTLFRVGIRDGTEEKDGKACAGEDFVFLALGKARSGKLYWYPPPGPDASWEKGVTNEMLAYEFLLNREKFETLDKRYR